MRGISKNGRLFTITILISLIFVLMNISAVSAATCSACDGNGSRRCDQCGGQGYTTTSVLTGPNIWSSRDIVTWCTNCYGGWVDCTYCGGTGEVGADQPVLKHGTVYAATDGVGEYEDAKNLFDGLTVTKFCVKSSAAYVLWEAPEEIRVKAYTITTANDNVRYKGRNPKDWALYGSTKKLGKYDTGWEIISVVENDTILQDENYKPFTYKLSSETKPYKYFKLEISATKGDSCLQLSEFKLEGRTGAANNTGSTATTSTTTTTNKGTGGTQSEANTSKNKATLGYIVLRSVKKKGKTGVIKWEPVSGADGYEVQYGRSSTFKKCKKVTVKGGSKQTKKIKKLDKYGEYYVRVRAYKTVNGKKVYTYWSRQGRMI